MHEIIIVGAGIAGLTAAYKLRHRDLVVLEEQAVAGGRTLSRRLGDFVYNAGAQVIMGNESPAARLADELGVSRSLIAKTRVPLFFRGRLYRARTQAGLLASLPIGIGDKLRFALRALRIRHRYRPLLARGFDPRDPRVIELNRGPASQFLGRLSPDLTDLWNAIATISDGESIDLTTAYHTIMVMMHFLAEEYAVEGGTHQLTLAMHRALEARTRLATRAISVVEREDAVEVRAEHAGRECGFQARRCVLAVPAPVARSLVGSLPDRKREALQRVDYASQTSAAFLLDVPSTSILGAGVWRVPVAGRLVCALTDPTFFYPEAFRRRSGHGMLRLYTGDLASKHLQSLAREPALEELQAELDGMFPGLARHVVERDIAHWELANPQWRAGHPELVPILQAPTGRLHFCGDYTGPGYLNGSVASGLRVVEELAARTGG